MTGLWASSTYDVACMYVGFCKAIKAAICTASMKNTCAYVWIEDVSGRCPNSAFTSTTALTFCISSSADTRAAAWSETRRLVCAFLASIDAFLAPWNGIRVTATGHLAQVS